MLNSNQFSFLNRLKISTKINLMIISCLSIFMFSLSVLFINVIIRGAENEAEQNNKYILALASDLYLSPLMESDFAAIMALTLNFLEDDKIVKVAVYNDKGVNVITINQHIDPTIQNVREFRHKIAITAGGGEGGLIIGDVAIWFNMDHLHDKMAYARTILFLFIAISMLLTTLLMRFLLNRFIRRPITELSKSVLAVKQGNLNEKVTVHASDEIGALASAFNEMTAHLHSVHELTTAKEGAEEANKAKSDFLVRMSHEIRTPINAIIGLGCLLKKTELTDQQQDYAFKIQSSAETLLAIINDILDFSKIEAGKMTLEKISYSMDHIWQAISNIMTVKTQERGLEFLFDISDTIPKKLIGDPTRIGQILINLVGNAVKFTQKGEIIIIVDWEDCPEGPKLKFCVSDTGIGMTKAQCHKLFKSSTQADGTITRKYGGTGEKPLLYLT